MSIFEKLYATCAVLFFLSVLLGAVGNCTDEPSVMNAGFKGAVISVGTAGATVLVHIWS